MIAGLLMGLLGACGARHTVRLSSDTEIAVSRVRLSASERRELPDGEIVCTLRASERGVEVVACLGAPQGQVQFLARDWQVKAAHLKFGAPQLMGMHILSEPRAVVFMAPRHVDKRPQLPVPSSIDLHTSEAKLKRRVEVQVPRWKTIVGVVPEQCRVRFEVSSHGEPLMVSVLDCPPRWRDDVATAAWKWRFYPAMVGAERVSSTITLDVSIR